VLQELVQRALHDAGQAALAGQYAARRPAQAFDHRQVVFHIAHHRADGDFIGPAGQPHSAVLAPYGFHPARLRKAVGDLHEMRFGNAMRAGDFGDGAQAVRLPGQVHEQAHGVVGH